MLDKNAFKVLKYFRKTKTNQDASTIAFNVKLSKDNSKLLSLAEQGIYDLNEQGYIRQLEDKSYILTSRGRNYYLEFLKDYIYPIIVSILTALLINRLN